MICRYFNAGVEQIPMDTAKHTEVQSMTDPLEDKTVRYTSNLSRQPRNILVVGVPRSGTSLTSAVFSRKGYHVGWIEKDSGRIGDEGNPFGYFEADDVIARNVEILQRAGYSEDNTWLRAMITEEEIGQIDALEPSQAHREFIRQYGTHAPWIWKDPRLTLTLPYWWKILDARTTGVIVVWRDPEESYQSFVRCGWYQPSEQAREEVLHRIDVHLNAARRAIEKYSIPHITIHYDEYLKQPEIVVRRIGEFCGLRLEVRDLNVQKELNHSSRRGQFSAWMRRKLDQRGFRYLRVLKPLIPRAVLAWLLPEKRYVQRLGK